MEETNHGAKEFHKSEDRGLTEQHYLYVGSSGDEEIAGEQKRVDENA